mgnify:CR=1 FL=1
MIDFARGRISACIHCSPAILCTAMGLIDGEILLLAFGVVAKLVIVAAIGATAAKRPRGRPILSKDAITRISRLSAAVMIPSLIVSTTGASISAKLLKETVLAVAHGYGTAPPLSPAEALPAALACVDFAVVALPALLDKAAAPAGGEAPSGLRSIGAAGMSLLKEVVFAADDDGRDDDRPQPSLQLAVSGVVEEDDGTSV